MQGHGIIQDGQVFISDLSHHQVLAWKEVEAAVAGGEPDAILGANSIDDIDPDKNQGRDCSGSFET